MAERSALAAQMYTLREFCQSPPDIARTCAKVRKLGFEAIQVSAFGPIAPKELAKILSNEGLTCCATHVGFERLRDQPQQVAEEHQLWGCRHTAVPVTPEPYRSAGRYGDFGQELNRLAKTLQPLGLAVSYHNHSFELRKFNGRTGLEMLYASAEPRLVNAEIDTYWIQHGGGDPAAWITRLGPRQPLVHLKDMVMGPESQLMAEVGEGNLNWPAILQAAQQAQVQWYIIEQDVCQRDPFESLKISFENLRRMGIH